MGVESAETTATFAVVDSRTLGTDAADFAVDGPAEGEESLFSANAFSQGPLKKPKLSTGELTGPVSSPSGSTQSEHEDELESTFVIQNFSQISAERLYSPSFSSGPGEAVWRTLVFPYGNNGAVDSHLSVYVDLENPPNDPNWRYSNVQFQFQLLNQVRPDRPYLSEECNFCFTRKGSDRGFDAFFPLQRLKTGNEFLVDDKIEIRTVLKFLKSEPLESQNSANCRAKTGHVGLKNQGATCYMNSLLQTLFHIGYFRRSVYQLPLDDGVKPSIALALQKLFANLQTSEVSVCTKDLTASFGWQSIDSFMQHDVQEFSRVLCDNLETKMKNTSVEGVIAKLFEGKSEAFIDCINVDYKSTRTESFYDLSLNVKGLNNLYESFDQYVETETLEGPNQYRADTFGLQDARKGIRFISFPPVLFIQLKRFEYDPVHNNMIKLNDRFEFPAHLDLNKYVDNSNEDYNYVLYSVLVHSGSVYGGHYYACISPNPSKSPANTSDWFKFDDDFVSAIPQTSAVNDHYGGDLLAEQRQFSRRGREIRSKTANAYMLVYIRRNKLDETLGEMKESDIPTCVRERIASDELAAADIEAAALAEANKVTISFFTSQHLTAHTGLELLFTPTQIKIDYDRPCTDLVQEIATITNIAADSQVWYIYSKRENRTVRPNKVFDWRANIHKTVSEMFDLRQGWGTDGFSSAHDIYVHRYEPFDQVSAHDDMRDHTAMIPSRPNVASILLFFKWFNVASQSLSYIGSAIVPIMTPIHKLGMEILRLANMSTEIQIDIYEEEDIKANRITLLSAESTLSASKLVDGDIVVCQERLAVEAGPHFDCEESREGVPRSENSQLFYCRDVPSYLQMLYHRCIVTCIYVPLGFEAALPENRLIMRDDWTISQVIACLASSLQHTTPDRIIIFAKAYNEMAPNRNQQYTFLNNDITLDHLIKFCDDSSNPVFFQILDYSINDLNSHSVVNVHFFDENQQLRIFNVLIPIGCETAESLHEAISHNANVKLSESDKLRLLVVNSGRALAQLTRLSPLDHVLDNGPVQGTYIRADKYPASHLELPDDHAIVWVSRFMSGYVPKFYGEPVSVVIPKGQNLRECRQSLCSQIDSKNEDCRHIEQWTFAKMPVKGSVGMVIISDDQIVIPINDPAPDNCYFICVDQGRDGARRSSRINPLDRPVKIYN